MAWDIGPVEYGSSPAPVPGPTTPPSTTPPPGSVGVGGTEGEGPGGAGDVAPISVRQSGGAYFILARIFLDSGTEYESDRQIVHPNYIYDARVLEFGYIDRDIPVPAGLPRLGDCRIKLADTDRKWRDSGAHQTFRRRFIDFRMVGEGESESASDVFATFEIYEDEWTADVVEIFGRDLNFAWIDNPIPGLINRANFPDLMEGVDEAFLPIVAGILDAPSDASPPNPQGVLTLPRMTLTRWGLAQHPIAYVELCGRIENEVEFALIEPSEYVITEEPHTINGVDYTLSFIDFVEERDSGQQVRCRIIEGFYTRGEFAGMPAVQNSPLSGLRNPLDAWINVIYGVLRAETRIPRFNADSFTALRDKFNTSFVTSVSPAVGYSCDGAIDRPTTVRQFMADHQTSFEYDLFVNNRGEITVSATFDEDPDRVVFSDGPLFGEPTDTSLIGFNSVRQKRGSPAVNRLLYNSQLNYSTDEYAAKEVFNNEDDQNALGANLSPALPVIEPDTVEFKWVREPAVAQDVARRRMEFLALGSIRIELKLPLEQVATVVDLAQLFGVTHEGGLEIGGFHNKEFKATGITDDLDAMVRTLRGISRVPQLVDQIVHEEAPVLFTGETYMEMVDYGLGSSAAGPLPFRRTLSYFLQDVDPGFGFDEANTQFYFEGIGYNNEVSPVTWSISSDAVGASNPQATLVLPAGYSGRVRSNTVFIRDSFSTDFLIVAPQVTVGNASVMKRVRMVAVQTNTSKTLSEIRLSNNTGATALDQTIGGGDIFRTTSWGLIDDVSGFVSAGGPRWKYEVDAWSTVTNILFTAVMANASFHMDPGDPVRQSSQCALWDLTKEAESDPEDPGLVLLIDCATLLPPAGMFLTPQLFIVALPAVSNLTDQHVYEVRIRSVKDNAGQSDFNTYFHKARLLISVGPIESVEFHTRCGNDVPVGTLLETQAVHATGGFDPVPSVHFEASDDVGRTPLLVDLGTSDTANDGTEVNESQIPISDAMWKAARSGNIINALTEGNRYVAGDVLQGSLIYKLPAADPVPAFTPNDMSSREAFLTFLTDAGYTPNRAVLFDEGTGVPVEFYTSLTISEGGSPDWIENASGFAKKCQTADYFELGSTTFLSTTAQTVLLIRRKFDALSRNSHAFAVDSSTDGKRCGTHLPYGDGNVVWDFGGSAPPNRLVHTTYTPSVAVEAWAFRAGALGSSIWKDGASVMSQATAITRTASTNGFQINKGPGLSGDVQEFYFFALIPSEVSDAVLAQFTVNKVLFGI